MITILSLLLSGLLSYSQTSATTPLEGIWVRPCYQGGMQIQMIEDNSDTANEIFYEDAQCRTPLLAFVNDGTFEIHDKQINFEFQKVSLVLHSDKVVADFNQRSVCGKTDWKKNSPAEITGLQCALFQEHKLVQVPRAGEMRFGIWQVKETKLFFGLLTRELNGSTPEKRPVDLDQRPYFKQM